jgi:hypothetical protein
MALFPCRAFDGTARPDAICDFDPVTSRWRHDGITDDHRENMDKVPITSRVPRRRRGRAWQGAGRNYGAH